MALNVKKPSYAAWPTTFRVSNPDGGIIEHTAIIHYALAPDPTATFKMAVAGWEDGAFEEDGQPLPYSEENKEKVFGNLELAEGLLEGVRQIMRGEHLRKNSGTPSAG